MSIPPLLALPALVFPALVFDLDGTLVDSVPDLHRGVNHMLASYEAPALPIATVRRMVGDGVPALVGRALRAAGREMIDAAAAIQRFLDFYESSATELTRPYPDVPETLERLAAAGHRLAVCTNKPLRPTALVLEALDLARFFSAIVGGDSLPLRKPDPAPLRLALDQLGVAPREAALIGDSEIDMATARNAGVYAMLVSYGYARIPIADIDADVVVERFGDVPAALQHRAG
jgi:phosphoglycolate phosphatase